MQPLNWTLHRKKINYFDQSFCNVVSCPQQKKAFTVCRSRNLIVFEYIYHNFISIFPHCAQHITSSISKIAFHDFNQLRNRTNYHPSRIYIFLAINKFWCQKLQKIQHVSHSGFEGKSPKWPSKCRINNIFHWCDLSPSNALANSFAIKVSGDRLY